MHTHSTFYIVLCIVHSRNFLFSILSVQLPTCLLFFPSRNFSPFCSVLFCICNSEYNSIPNLKCMENGEWRTCILDFLLYFHLQSTCIVHRQSSIFHAPSCLVLSCRVMSFQVCGQKDSAQCQFQFWCAYKIPKYKYKYNYTVYGLR